MPADIASVSGVAPGFNNRRGVLPTLTAFATPIGIHTLAGAAIIVSGWLALR
jgi:hypothetical protein